MTEGQSEQELEHHLELWSDDPAATDLLSFDAVAATISDALLDPALDPVALGLSGPWGSGKTTVLTLVEQDLDARSTDERRILVIRTEPWRYDPSTGAKESLISEVLNALAQEVESSQTTVEGAKEKAKKLVMKLAQRIDWSKAIKLTAQTALAFQVPSVSDILSLVRDGPSAEGGAVEPKGLESFRAEFAELMGSEALAHVQAAAVLVDDLDRCLPETVIESLEAIRLFLSVPKMSFVIAADEERVADAIRTRFADTGTPQEKGADDEEPAKLYLHKIVQTTFPLPTLSRFDTQSFLLLLQLQAKLTIQNFGEIVEQCTDIRRAGGNMDDLKPLSGVDMSEELAFASRLTPILYEKLHGNPRRIKRFLNDLRVRQTIAARRGITLDPAVVAKLMVLEVLLPSDFERVLDWLAQGELRARLEALEIAAGRPAVAATGGSGEIESGGAVETDGEQKPLDGAVEVASADFGEGLLRWAKLPPPLDGVDLAPYLYLAASFSGVTLLDTSLPERLRDIAANLVSTSGADRQAVTDGDLDALTASEAEKLLLHLGRTVRDNPSSQRTGVTAILRIARRQSGQVAVAARALLMLPARDLTIGTPLLFLRNDPAELFDVVSTWRSQATAENVKRAIDDALNQRSA